MSSVPSNVDSAVLDKVALSAWIKEAALRLGFDLAGIAPAVAGLGAERMEQWLADGKQGEMRYMAEQQQARADPNLVLDGVRSVVVVALCYRSDEPRLPQAGEGRISRYAWGKDYHDVLRGRLKQLADELAEVAPEVRARPVVDSAPVMERDYARLAGLGWFGKNTLLLNKGLGSWFFLGALLLDCELEYDSPHTTDHCGSCTRCLDACPTNAFDGPYRLDPRRCISYLTIEHSSPIAEPLREGMGDWLFGCDVCQDVCPWNRKAPLATEDRFHPAADANPVQLRPLLRMTDDEFRRRFRGTPLFRSKRARVLRNAAIVAGNQQCSDALPELEALSHDADPTLREAAAWAIERIGRKDIGRAGATQPTDYTETSEA